MAQLEAIKVDLDVGPARRAVKRLRRDVDDANRELAILEERVNQRVTELEAELAQYRIRLVVEETS